MTSYSVEVRTLKEQKLVLSQKYYDSFEKALTDVKEFILNNYQKFNETLSVEFTEIKEEVDDAGNLLCRTSCRQLSNDNFYYDGVDFNKY